MLELVEIELFRHNKKSKSKVVNSSVIMNSNMANDVNIILNELLKSIPNLESGIYSAHIFHETGNVILTERIRIDVCKEYKINKYFMA